MTVQPSKTQQRRSHGSRETVICVKVIFLTYSIRNGCKIVFLRCTTESVNRLKQYYLQSSSDFYGFINGKAAVKSDLTLRFRCCFLHNSEHRLSRSIKSKSRLRHAAIMTLHWWMHWFWVTSLISLHASIGTAAPQSEETEHITTETQPETPRLERQSRAMYYGKTPVITTPLPLNITENHTENIEPIKTDNTNISIANTPADNITDIVHPSIIWTVVNTTEDINVTKVNETEAANVTETHNATFAPKKRNLTRPDVVKDDINIDGAAESRIVTEKPLSLETTFLQTRIPPNIESSRRVIDQNEGMDTGAIAGISFAALVLVALAGSTAFVLYRRRYLNKPQTLNDKCSNPDSSGYLDDSTVRDNSEEMYSLDNDSFLNSLEAMTIQNYWTDTVKHTKL